MFSDIRALQSVYPLLPDSTIYKDSTSERYTRARCIRDAFVHVDLGPSDAADNATRHGVACVLKGVRTASDGTSKVASVAVMCEEYGIINTTGDDTACVYDIPLYTHKDEYKYAYDEYTGSNDPTHLIHGYIVADDSIQNGDIDLYIHPDCIVVSQRPPSLYAINSTKMKKGGVHTGEDQYLVRMSDLSGVWFVDGHNANVSLYPDGVTILLTPESGLGVYDAQPFVDADADIDKIGITSINGLSGAVQIAGGPSVRVNATTISRGICVELSVNEAKQEE